MDKIKLITHGTKEEVQAILRLVLDLHIDKYGEENSVQRLKEIGLTVKGE